MANADGHGVVYGVDGHGNVTHTTTVKDLEGLASSPGLLGRMYNDVPLNAPFEKTLRESTTRYDGRHRPVARTVWLEPLPNNAPLSDPPILPGETGAEGLSAGAALTTYWVYDDNMADANGLSGTSGVSVGGLPTTFSLDVVKAQLNALTGLSFVTGGTIATQKGDGSAKLEVNPSGEATFWICDGADRLVATGHLDGDKPITLTAYQYDIEETVGGSELVKTKAIVAEEINAATGTVVESSWSSVWVDGEDRAWRAERESELAGAGNEDVTIYEYDANGNQLSIRDANSVGWDAKTAQGAPDHDGYDARNNLVARTDTYGDTTRWAYDKEGNRILEVDAKHTISMPSDVWNPPAVGYTKTVYDALGRAIEINDRNGGVTKFGYDTVGNLMFVEDADAAAGERTVYVYDSRYNRTEERMPGHNPNSVVGDPDYDKRVFKYDATERLVRLTDQLGDTVQFVYDMADRLEHREYRTEANSSAEDSADNLIGTIADQDDFTYDGMGRVLTAISGRYANTVTCEYDANGNQLSIRDANSVGWDAKTAQGAPDHDGYDARNNLVARIASSATSSSNRPRRPL